MPTKANIETLITTDLASASSITAAEHRNVLKDDSNSILSELYKTTAITDTQVSTNVFTISGSSKLYTMYIKKQGGNVTITGTYFQTSGNTYGTDTAFATITNAEYQPTTNTYFSGYTTYGGENLRMSLYDNGGTWEIRTVDPIGSNETITFNITYFVGA